MQEVLKGISFSVASGECFGLLGPNGAGKITTLRCCLGHTEPDGGSIRLAELDIPRHSRAAPRARIGVVSQFDNRDVHFTVAENLIVYGRYFGLKQQRDWEKVEARCSKALLGGGGVHRPVRT